MSLDENDVSALFAKYLDAWNGRDFAAIAACFTEPCSFVQAAGVMAASDHVSLEDSLRGLFEGLEAKGFDRSTLGAITVRSCGPGLAIADVAEVCRWHKDGSLLEVIDGHYVLRQDADHGWRIAVAVACAAGWRTA